MTVRIARLALIGLAFAAACSDSGDGGAKSTDAPSSPTTEPTSTTESVATTTESAPTTTTEPAAVAVPAGVNWTLSSLAPPIGSVVALPTFEQVTATAGVPPAPPGFPFRDSDYIGRIFNVGGVQLATGSCGCWEGGNSTGVFGGLRTPIYLFRSVDAGATWAQVDLSGVLGDVNGQINNIVEHGGALTMTATVSDAGGVTPAVIEVLRSADGAAWERAGTIVSDAATAVPVHAFDLFSLGSSLVIYGGDMACEFDGSSAIQNIGPAYQTRIWTSTDGGASWVAQSPADTGFDIGRLPLPDAAACEGLDTQTVLTTYASGARLISLADDRVTVWSADGQRIVTSSDGITWSTATLDGALATPSEEVAEPEVTSEASTILAIDGQYVAMNLENYRNIDDTASGSSVGLSVVTWTSSDGVSWQRQPLGRPIVATDIGANYQFFTADGRLGLRSFDRLEDVEFAVYESVAGEAEDWTTCVATAGANCAFSTELSAFQPGADLSAIDLSYASLEGRDLTDVSFAGAHLRATNLDDVTIQRTNFDGADLEFVPLIGDLTTSTFVGATLSNIAFDDRFFSIELSGATISSPRITISDAGLPSGVSMVGRDLTGYEFTNGSLAGVDFSGANLTGSSFSYTDLTGAILTGAVLDGVFFFDVTCPDGQPIAEGAFGPASCRL